MLYLMAPAISINKWAVGRELIFPSVPKPSPVIVPS